MCSDSRYKYTNTELSKEMNAQIEEAAKIGRKIPKIERNAQEQQVRIMPLYWERDRLKSLQAALDTISQELANLEVELKELGDMNELTQNKERVQTEISRNKEELRELAVSIREIFFQLVSSFSPE